MTASVPRLAALATLAVVAACAPDTTLPWDLVNDRIVAVRAAAPGLAPGERAAIDVLITSEAAGPAEVTPMLVGLLPATPAPLAGTVAPSGGGWTVTAPDAAAIEAARVALGLAAGAPVPLGLVVTVGIGDQVYVAIKTVFLGAAVANPAIDAVRVDGVVADGAVTLARGERELAIDADLDDDVAWFTSSGDLDDVDDAVAHLTVDAPADGQLVVVRRTPAGGVAWRIVAFRVE